MNSNLFFIFLLLMSPLFFTSSFASINDFTTDKTLYNTDDSLVLSGSVDYNPDLFSIIVQIITPSGSGLAHVDSIVPNNDGTFTKTINVGGPTWSENGDYTIKISYGENLEKSIEYQKSSEYIPPTSTPPTSTPPTSTPPTSTPPTSTPPTSTSSTADDSFIENPKMTLFGFPSFDKSPQYYIDRYDSQSSYRNWFDSQFPNHTVDEVVGYSSTHVENYPSLENSPQYYVDRYNTEPEYKSWFDSQFPEQTIYSVLGFSTYVPEWIKAYAQSEITDNEFKNGLNFMLQNKIIVINGIEPESSSIDHIPSWFRNTADWWSDDLISQQEFINSIKYLVQEDVIMIG